MQGGDKMKRLIALCLICASLCGLFSGCGNSDPDNYTPTGDAILLEGMEPEDLIQEEEEPDELVLAYDPTRSMNPLIGNSISNRVLFSLMYQGLFAYNSRNVAVPILCSRYRVSPDNTIYTFYVDSRATFSDGTRVTIDDVFDSYAAAKDSNYYKGRFTHIVEIRKNDDGSMTFYLDTPYENLFVLLDIPIVKSSQVDADFPLGTGPYAFVPGNNGATLNRVSSWWCNTKIATNAPVITLMEKTSQDQIRDEFEFGDLSLAIANPMLDSYAEYRCDYELWNVENGIFLYVGINALYSEYFKNNESLRKALTYAIDRETINKDYYRGLAQPSTLPTSPGSPYYNSNLASRYEYDPMKFLDAISGFQIPKTEKGEIKKMKLLVNSDDSARLRAARYLAAHLTELGIPTGTLEYGSSGPGTTYEQVLRAGTYDLYLGQTKLSPNYDLSQFYKGYGNVGYGGITDGTLLARTKEALANSGIYYNLNKEVVEDAKIIPVLFGCYNVFSLRGSLLDLTPSRDNIFYYTIGKTTKGILEKTD